MINKLLEKNTKVTEIVLVTTVIIFFGGLFMCATLFVENLTNTKAELINNTQKTQRNTVISEASIRVSVEQKYRIDKLEANMRELQAEIKKMRSKQDSANK